MATRRLAPPRTKTSTASSTASSSSAFPRSRPAATKQPSQDVTPSQPPSSQQSFDPSLLNTRPSKPSGYEDFESNIRVIIRCRGRSEREVQENSPSIVNLKGAKSKDVCIETAAPSSILGVVTSAPIRTYPFDLVFGPEADQAMIYHEVVHPMVEEVLMGYNCTLFAYGQTGTGKTYTMQGDLVPTPMGNPSPNAGMIPRVLFRLFHHLETSGADYSVKISYIELYNEELRDLLASESQSSGNSKDQAKQWDGGLKIFDDTSKRGVIIQGLEEILVKDSKDALHLLTKGSLKRQIAATKFNDHSSRSHSVFSITVHTKEGASAGEDLLKIGKLNLVDLAGSENIGRSGAENKRAREAGMINQSLLTLGRVINALVDKSSHIPYRESKLTRLLQDSLGGRTKTCIIATISPARSNMEETLSTLDYALRAKSIRNKPELNQRMTRNSLLKEYVAEIERLKADLVAAREKNGIFFSEETWNQMMAEQELRRTELEESKKEIEIIEQRMRNLREEFDQSIGLLKKRETELKDVTEQLRVTQSTLEERTAELSETQVALQEEVVVREAHQTTEVNLDGVAGNLLSVTRASVRDVTGLFQKLERQSNVLTSNSQVTSNHGKALISATRVLSELLSQFVNTSCEAAANLEYQAQSVRSSELVALEEHSKVIEDRLDVLQQTLETIEVHDQTESEALGIAQGVLREAHKVFREGFESWAIKFRETFQRYVEALRSGTINGFKTVEDTMRDVVSILDTIITDTRHFVEEQSLKIVETRELAMSTVRDEVARLKQQNGHLVRLLEQERAKGLQAKKDLLQQMSSLMDSFVAERDDSLSRALGAARQSNEQAGTKLGVLERDYEQLYKALGKSSTTMGESLQKWDDRGAAKRQQSLQVLATSSSNFSDQLQSLETNLSDSLNTYNAELQNQVAAMHTSYSDAFARQSTARTERTRVTRTFMQSTQTHYDSLSQGLLDAKGAIETFTENTIEEVANLTSELDKYDETASQKLGSILQDAQNLLNQGVKEVVRTGTTPRKRAWEYPEEWQLTRTREEVLRAWKRADAAESITEEELLAPPESDDEAGPMPVDAPESPIDPQILTPVDSPPLEVRSVASSTSSIQLPVSRITTRQHRRTIGKPSVTGTSAIPLADSRPLHTKSSRRPR
ncbi:hypothetical protein AX16_003769 [Volvariella volvacea WC 439]|nr:hypothetical protein AX16_003769 [Volvariella volvacea WC 439]